MLKYAIFVAKRQHTTFLDPTILAYALGEFVVGDFRLGEEAAY